MTPEQGIVLGVAGFLGGAVNSVAGGGSLISFPALLAVGYPGVTANMTNTVALWPGYVGSSVAYRRELEGQRSRAVVLAATCIVGGLAGSVLLLTTPASVFKQAVPWLILLACALFALQPLATRSLAKRQAPSKEHRSLGLHVAVFLAAIYGAYFGAGLGIVLLAVLGLAIPDSLQKLNGLKQVLSVVINSVAVVAYGVFGSRRVDCGRHHGRGQPCRGPSRRRLCPPAEPDPAARRRPRLRRHGRLHPACPAMTPARQVGTLREHVHRPC